MTEHTTAADGFAPRDLVVAAAGVAVLVGVTVVSAVALPGFLEVPNAWRAVVGAVVAVVLRDVFVRMFTRLGDTVLAQSGAGRSVYVVVGLLARFVGALIAVTVGLATLGPGAQVSAAAPVVLAALITAVDLAVGKASPALRD